jgi:hypothetical protein
MTLAPNHRWFQITLREWFLALAALGFGIAWAREHYRHWNEPLTIEQAVEMMRQRKTSDLQIVSQLEDDGEWFRYTLHREKETK